MYGFYSTLCNCWALACHHSADMLQQPDVAVNLSSRFAVLYRCMALKMPTKKLHLSFSRGEKTAPEQCLEDERWPTAILPIYNYARNPQRHVCSAILCVCNLREDVCKVELGTSFVLLTHDGLYCVSVAYTLPWVGIGCTCSRHLCSAIANRTCSLFHT